MNLVGQSFGGLIALNYAIKNPQNLIILESAPASSEYEAEFANSIAEKLNIKEKAKQIQIRQSEVSNTMILKRISNLIFHFLRLVFMIDPITK